MSEPIISVIIPIYNSGERLRPCVESILAQSYKNIQLILVNDGSTDNTAQILAEYKAAHPEIILIEKENGGVSSARNRGLLAATGDYIGFVDADDVIDADMYEYLLGAGERYGADLAQCAMRLAYPGGATEILCAPAEPTVIKVREGIAAESLRHFSGSTCTKLFSRRAIEGLSYSTELVVGEDMLYSLEALSAAEVAVLLPEAKYTYIQGEESAMHSYDERHLRSYGEMLDIAEARLGKSGGVGELLRAERMKYAMDTTSKITLSENRQDALLSEIRAAVRRGLGELGKTTLLSRRERLKLWLIAHCYPLYRAMLLTIKGRRKNK